MVAAALIARFASAVMARVAVEGGAEAAEGLIDSSRAGPSFHKIMIPVASEPISAIGFDEEQGEITVVFKRGGHIVYNYPGTLEDFIAFAMAPSKGQYFNANFK